MDTKASEIRWIRASDLFSKPKLVIITFKLRWRFSAQCGVVGGERFPARRREPGETWELLVSRRAGRGGNFQAHLQEVGAQRPGGGSIIKIS